ncbi:MAG: DUF4926 domain-containing protein [Microcystis aeruginosa G11-06]|nr:DUF4926 domain-containing protein [Microcystis aeruginosa G11-06]
MVEKHQIEGLERVYRVEFFDRLGKTITVVTLPENSLRFPAPLRTRVKLINHAGVTYSNNSPKHSKNEP